MRSLSFLLPLLAGATALFGQSDMQLRRYFEGMSVVVKIDMPGSSQGVEVRPNDELPLDFRKLAEETKRYGVGIHQGDRIMVTKVLIKGDHIEFQLGGGGFGTFADRARTMQAPAGTYESKSRYEKDLEDRVKWAHGWERTRLQNQLNQARRDRLRNNLDTASANAQLRQQQQANIREERKGAGSRFNILYKNGFSADSTTPEGIMSALANYLEFQDGPGGGGSGSGQSAGAGWDSGQGQDAGSSGPPLALRKGMTVSQVEQMLGPAESVNRDSQAAVEIVARKYTTAEGQRVTAKFAGGVLVDFTVKAGQ
jgi:hypothetical protein